MEIMNVLSDFAETWCGLFFVCFCLFVFCFVVLCRIKYFSLLPNGCLYLAFYFHTRA